MKKAGIKTLAPATLSDIGCGEGVLSHALEGIHNEVVLKQGNTKGVHISQISGNRETFSKEAKENPAGIAVQKVLKSLGREDICVELRLHQAIPPNVNLGSALAFATAAAFGINEWLGRPLDKQDLLPLIRESVFPFANDISLHRTAACILGGLRLSTGQSQNTPLRLPIPAGIHVVLLTLNFSTREIQEESKVQNSLLSHPEHIQKMGQLGSFVAGCYRNDLLLIQQNLPFPSAPPYSSLPEIDALFQWAYQQGALCAGFTPPSLFYFWTPNNLIADTIIEQAKAHFDQSPSSLQIYLSKIRQDGARKC